MHLLRKFKVSSIYKQFGVMILFAFLLHACANTPPVQEMSNARQTLKAAEAVKAAQLAPVLFRNAQKLLDDAESELASGHYARARASAMAARQEAIRARQAALSKQKKNIE